MKFRCPLLSLLILILPIVSPLQGAVQKPQIDLQQFSSFKKVGAGDTLYSILQREGFSSSQTANMVAALPELKQYVLVPKSLYRVVKIDERLHIRFYDLTTDLTFNFARTDKGIRSYAKVENFVVKPVKYRGSVNGSLIASIKKVLPNAQVAYRFMDAYLLKYDLTKDLSPGANFSFIVEHKYDGGRFVRYGEILQTSLEIDGNAKVREYVRYKEGGAFIGEEDLTSNRPLYSPVHYMTVSSQFQPRRKHPITKRRQPHLGIDFVLPTGAPILSAADGTVLRHGKGRASGRFVVISHGRGRETYYNHMNDIASHIKRGTKVRAGERIGSNGCTGYCTKPHLHFAYKVHGHWKNPADFVRPYPKSAIKHLVRHVAQADDDDESSSSL